MPLARQWKTFIRNGAIKPLGRFYNFLNNMLTSHYALTENWTVTGDFRHEMQVLCIPKNIDVMLQETNFIFSTGDVGEVFYYIDYPYGVELIINNKPGGDFNRYIFGGWDIVMNGKLNNLSLERKKDKVTLKINGERVGPTHTIDREIIFAGQVTGKNRRSPDFVANIKMTDLENPDNCSFYPLNSEIDNFEMDTLHPSIPYDAGDLLIPTDEFCEYSHIDNVIEVRRGSNTTAYHPYARFDNIFTHEVYYLITATIDGTNTLSRPFIGTGDNSSLSNEILSGVAGEKITITKMVRPVGGDSLYIGFMSSDAQVGERVVVTDLKIEQVDRGMVFINIPEENHMNFISKGKNKGIISTDVLDGEAFYAATALSSASNWNFGFEITSYIGLTNKYENRICKWLSILYSGSTYRIEIEISRYVSGSLVLANVTLAEEDYPLIINRKGKVVFDFVADSSHLRIEAKGDYADFDVKSFTCKQVWK